MKHDAHTHFIMRDTEAFYVRICGCGVVHLCFGPTTLNLTQQAVVAVSETLKEVAQELVLRTLRTEPSSAPVSSQSPNSEHDMTQASMISSAIPNVIQGRFQKSDH